MPFRVLVVDDQTISRQLFESFIASSERYELAASVSTARYADSYCAAGKVDLVLMDVVKCLPSYQVKLQFLIHDHHQV